jgi:hypothetical protein
LENEECRRAAHLPCIEQSRIGAPKLRVWNGARNAWIRVNTFFVNQPFILEERDLDKATEFSVGELIHLFLTEPVMINLRDFARFIYLATEDDERFPLADYVNIVAALDRQATLVNEIRLKASTSKWFDGDMSRVITNDWPISECSRAVGLATTHDEALANVKAYYQSQVAKIQADMERVWGAT